ncbi:hypothetical protein EV424DRAFT_1344813 [Suillus variegatus]|nr:hypothetical protein EV424DRAFT_1344813 [Suillus variegatus]
MWELINYTPSGASRQDRTRIGQVHGKNVGQRGRCIGSAGQSVGSANQSVGYHREVNAVRWAFDMMHEMAEYELSDSLSATATCLDKRSSHPCLSCIRCSTKKIKCTQGKATTGRTHSKTPAAAPSNAPSRSHQSHGPPRTPAIPAATTPQVQSHGCSKTITAKKTPARATAPAPVPAAVPSSNVTVPCAALDVPMPDLYSMAIVIRDGAARIAILKAHVQEQDDKIDTLQRLHESLRRKDGSAMVGLMVEPTQVQPEGPQSSSEIVVPDEPGNLLPEYNSSDEEMDVGVEVERPGEEVEMAT